MTKIIELRPDKALMNPKFEKYQFTPELVPVAFEGRLEKEILRTEPNSSQDSWLEARLFAFHNHLFKNPFDSSCWFVDAGRKIWRFDQTSKLQEIYTLPATSTESTNYNPSIAFATDKLVLVSFGSKIHLLFFEPDSTQEKKSSLVTIDGEDPGVIVDARYVKKSSTLLVALCGITDVEGKGKKCTSISLLKYPLEQDSDGRFQTPSPKSTEKRIIRVKGAIEYCYIEPNGDYIHALAQETMVFFHDSSNPIEEEDSRTETTNGREIDVKIPKYYWSQDEDSLTVWVKVPGNVESAGTKVNVTPCEVSIIINEEDVLIQGETQFRLDNKLTTWRREKDTLRLELFKHESGLMWNELIKGDTGGECVPNETLAAEIHSRLAHLCTERQGSSRNEGQPVIGFNAEQLEECDVSGRENLLQRINLSERKITHMAMLGTSNHLIFTYKSRSGQVLCLRHDHDGCIWKAEDSEDPENWELRNTSTLPGFGYVEASKSNKKFCVSPPDGSYAVIVEHTRHAFIYEQPVNKNSIGRQRIVDLGTESTSPIVGAVATNSYLYLLTMDKLFQLQIAV